MVTFTSKQRREVDIPFLPFKRLKVVNFIFLPDKDAILPRVTKMQFIAVSPSPCQQKLQNTALVFFP